MTDEAAHAAYVATGYLLGRRGRELLFGVVEPRAQAAHLAARLGHPDRTTRAHALAPELARLTRVLDVWRLR